MSENYYQQIQLQYCDEGDSEYYIGSEISPMCIIGTKRELIDICVTADNPVALGYVHRDTTSRIAAFQVGRVGVHFYLRVRDASLP